MTSYNVPDWIEYAQRDYDTAKIMLETHHPLPIEIILYLCQQSSEKILKAYALANNEPLIYTHDLETLLEQCFRHEKEFDQFRELCANITLYASNTRYPQITDRYTINDVKTALDGAYEILEFTKARIV
jgi:HEPN domain-containing protein